MNEVIRMQDWDYIDKQILSIMAQVLDDDTILLGINADKYADLEYVFFINFYLSKT